MTHVASFPCGNAIVGSATGRAPCTSNGEPRVLATTILASSMVFIDGTVVNVALPALQRRARTSIEGAVAGAFVAGFRRVMLIAALLALASAASAWLMIGRRSSTRASLRPHV